MGGREGEREEGREGGREGERVNWMAWLHAVVCAVVNVGERRAYSRMLCACVFLYIRVYSCAHLSIRLLYSCVYVSTLLKEESCYLVGGEGRVCLQ